MALGATSIADVYRAEERGSKLGIFVAIPLLAPAIGPVIGGAISRGAGWRPTFLFLVAYGTFCLVLMLFIPETYRKERSAVWQKAAFRASETNSKVELTLRDANVSFLFSLAILFVLIFLIAFPIGLADSRQTRWNERTRSRRFLSIVCTPIHDIILIES